MPDLLGVTNPVPGYENTGVNRGLPATPSEAQIQNIPDPSRVGRADGRGEAQNNSDLKNGAGVRYDSNLQTFLQRLQELANPLEELSRIFSGRQGMVVTSGMSEGLAAEMSRFMEMLHMDSAQFLAFLKGQARSANRFGGPLFSILRNAYSATDSRGMREDILQFAKKYSDFSSTAHVEGNLLRNMRGMAQALPPRWAAALTDLQARLARGMDAGDRQGNLKLLQNEVVPLLSRYVDQTHDMGRTRALLSLLSLDITRYENGGEESVLKAFHQLNGYGALKEKLGPLDDSVLLRLLRDTPFARAAKEDAFADRLVETAARALRGEGGMDTQEAFREIVRSLLINESVYMPLNHYLIPLEWDGRMLFSEIWTDPDENREDGGDGGDGGAGRRMLLKMDIQDLGLFDLMLVSRGESVDLRVFCPDKVAPFARIIQTALAQILTENGLTVENVQVGKLERPLTISEAFPGLFDGKSGVNVVV